MLSSCTRQSIYYILEHTQSDVTIAYAFWIRYCLSISTFHLDVDFGSSAIQPVKCHLCVDGKGLATPRSCCDSINFKISATYRLNQTSASYYQFHGHRLPFHQWWMLCWPETTRQNDPAENKPVMFSRLDNFNDEIAKCVNNTSDDSSYSFSDASDHRIQA